MWRIHSPKECSAFKLRFPIRTAQSHQVPQERTFDSHKFSLMTSTSRARKHYMPYSYNNELIRSFIYIAAPWRLARRHENGCYKLTTCNLLPIHTVVRMPRLTTPAYNIDSLIWAAWSVSLTRFVECLPSLASWPCMDLTNLQDKALRWAMKTRTNSIRIIDWLSQTMMNISVLSIFAGRKDCTICLMLIVTRV